jgi:hypothetical protein
MTLLALPAHLALVDETRSIPRADLQQAAGALNEWISRDVGPVWKLSASVGVYDQVPRNTWAMKIRERLDEPGALGYHTAENNVPVSYIMLTDGWAQTVAHEAGEMLADPSGSRMHGGRLPHGLEPAYREFGLKHSTSHVDYLLEICDPPEAPPFFVGGVALSDFILPSWYFAYAGTHTAFSYAGTCKHPREVAAGGYVSFAVGDRWFQVFNRGGDLKLMDLGTFAAARREYGFETLREFTDFMARRFRS